MPLQKTLSMEITTQGPLYASYKEYIDKNVQSWPDLRWAQRFLEIEPPDPSETTVLLLDSYGDRMVDQEFGDENMSDLRDALENRPAAVKTRIIFVSYEETMSIDRSVVDILGLKFDIDPLFLHEHFYHSTLECEEDYVAANDPGLTLLTTPRARLPSEYQQYMRTIHLPWDGDNQISVQLRTDYENEGANTSTGA